AGMVALVTVGFARLMGALARQPSGTSGRRSWRLAVKIGLLNIALCAALAVALTWLGTYRAVNGLQEQAEAALGADARAVADGVDAWHAERMRQLRALAGIRVVRAYLQASPASRGSMAGAVHDVLASYNNVASDVDSIALADRTGT